jgi:hypothetical protein
LKRTARAYPNPISYKGEYCYRLIFQVNQALEVLKTKYLRAWISYEGLQRIESWPVPMPALREAVLNAVVHKDVWQAASALDTEAKMPSLEPNDLGKAIVSAQMSQTHR